MTVFILGLTAALLLLAVSIYILLLKKNLRVAVFAVGASILIPPLLVTGTCILNPSADACSWGKAHLPYYLAVSAITMGPLIYLLMTAAFHYRKHRARKYRYNRRSHGDEAVRFNGEKLIHINSEGQSQSMRWSQIDEIRVVTATVKPSGRDLGWIFANRNQSRQIRIGSRAHGMKQLVAHIRRLPDFDQDSFKMAMATTAEINFLVWMRA